MRGAAESRLTPADIWLPFRAVILVDRFENVRRLEALIRTLDAAEMVKPRAATDNAEPQH
jgi:hypothetical protein